MRRRSVFAILLVVSSLAAPPAFGWGDKTHRFLTRAAVRSLPPAAKNYYAPHEDVLKRRCLEPDTILRERDGREETIRHFIDLDAHMPAPFIGFPTLFDDAVRRFGRRKVERNGVLPWVILRVRRQLKEAIEAGNVESAMREAGYLSHYIADSFQPLHLTTNHDGQKSNARGLHRRYENGLVDARIDPYGAEVLRNMGSADAISDPRQVVFERMFRTYEAVDLLIAADRKAAGRARRGSARYYESLDADLQVVTVRQLSSAASMIGSFWLTAWQEAKKEDRSPARPD